MHMYNLNKNIIITMIDGPVVKCELVLFKVKGSIPDARNFFIKKDL